MCLSRSNKYQFYSLWFAPTLKTSTLTITPLMQFSTHTWYTKYKNLTHHEKLLTCSHHDLIAEKLIKLKITQLLTISFWFLLITGSFYTVYPRHRTLISINKRNTGKTNKEYCHVDRQTGTCIHELFYQF
jgi:hypothetical protein